MIFRYFVEGGGWRFVILYQKGHKWIHFIDQSTFQTYKRPLRELPHLKPLEYSPRKLARAMSKRRAMFKRLGVPFPKRAVQRAIDALKHGT